MQQDRRLPIAFLGFVIVLAILVGGSFILNRWLPQPATYLPSTGSPPGSLADDPSDYLPDTGLEQLTSPISTTSYYITSLDPQDAYNLGHDLGQRDWLKIGTQDDVVILDYGYPSKDPYGGGGYGIILAYGDGSYHSNASVADTSEICRGVFLWNFNR